VLRGKDRSDDAGKRGGRGKAKGKGQKACEGSRGRCVQGGERKTSKAIVSSAAANVKI